ncbi:MAG: hypothetical protein HOJ90_04255 [Alphaproteobacteria bacterium]|nr:hypothetical protein [Alphaproteobacteria bacterium]
MASTRRLGGILGSLTVTGTKGAPINDSRPFDEAERKRFHNLLLLANESPYEGERSAALAAAERMSKARGMTLEEAASGGPPPPEPKKKPRKRKASGMQDKAMDRASRMTDDWLDADKARRDAALEEARERGLDADERRRQAAAANRVQRRNGRKRDPQSHAHVLLSETSLPLEEIASMTGLNMYELVSMKLKLRRAAS